MSTDQRTTKQRGYDSHHKRLRARLAHTVATGKATCWRCNKPIAPNQPWDLGHDDNDRTQYRGIECVPCNRATNGRTQPTPDWDTSRQW